MAVEQRCSEAFTAVRHFEKTHCLALQNMGYTYLQRRNELVAKCLDVAARLGVREEAGHDGVLLMDRVMSTSLALAPDLLDLLAVSCVVIAAQQVDGPATAAGMAPGLPADADVGGASGLPRPAVEQMEWNIRSVLAQVRQAGREGGREGRKGCGTVAAAAAADGWSRRPVDFP